MITREADVDESESPADDTRAAEEALDSIGPGVGREIEILGLESCKQVAHAASDQVGLMAFALELLHDEDGAIIQQPTWDELRPPDRLVGLRAARRP